MIGLPEEVASYPTCHTWRAVKEILDGVWGPGVDWVDRASRSPHWLCFAAIGTPQLV